MLIMRAKNERVELAIRIMRYRELSRRTTDEGFLRPIKDKIAELESRSSARSTSELARNLSNKSANERHGRSSPNIQVRQ